MMNRITFIFVKINLAAALFLLFAVNSVYAQTFPDGLIGLPNSIPGVLYSIDASNGAATPIVTLNGRGALNGLSYLQDTLYGTDLRDFPGVDDFDIGSIATDGVITFLGNQNGSSNWHALASDETNGVLYSMDVGGLNGILERQFTDGSIVTVGPVMGVRASGMAYDDASGILYAVDFDGVLYTVSTINGTPNTIGPTGISGNKKGLAYDECDRILYLNDGISKQLYTLDISTGAATLVGSNDLVDDDINGLAWKGTCPRAISEVPTLSEWGLIAMAGVLGIVGFMVIRRRKVTA